MAVNLLIPIVLTAIPVNESGIGFQPVEKPIKKTGWKPIPPFESDQMLASLNGIAFNRLPSASYHRQERRLRLPVKRMTNR